MTVISDHALKKLEEAHPQLRDKCFTGFQGDLVSSNIQEILDWIENNCKGGVQFDGLAMLYTLKFDNEEDIPLFTLRWL